MNNSARKTNNDNLNEKRKQSFNNIKKVNLKDRSSESYAERVVSGLYEDEESRRIALEFLADSIGYCSSKSPKCWEVTLFDNMIRLNAGRVYSIDLKRENVEFCADPKALSESTLKTFEGYITVQKVFKSIDEEVAEIRMPIDVFADSLEDFKEAHISFLDKAIESSQISPFTRGYSPGVIDHLNSFLGMKLPHPGYYSKTNFSDTKTQPDGNVFFSRKAVELLEGIHSDPTKEFYSLNREDFVQFIEKPMKELFSKVKANLPDYVLKTLETEKNILGKFLKNDYGKGGVWDFIWGAFYPKNGKRILDAQLYVSMNRNSLDYGFSFGSQKDTSTFRKILSENSSEIKELMEEELSDRFDFYGKNAFKSFREWIENIRDAHLNVHASIPAEELVKTGKSALIAKISDAFISAFPFMLVSIEESMEGVRDLFGSEENEISPEYSLEDLSADSGFELSRIEELVSALKRKKQAIIYGPPGTGKTFLAKKLADHLVGGTDGIRDVVQFHPSYSYEDFIGGIRPKSDENGALTYPVVPGRFLEFCKEARRRKGNCVLVIDEINRANLSRVFGELMYLLEYRNEEVLLAVDGKRFRIPENVYIIGTMNTADRTIALVDYALRRRFVFMKLDPEFGILRKFHDKGEFDPNGLIGVLERLNKSIESHFMVGISFFLKENLKDEIESVWKTEIEPYLEEYFFDQPTKLDEFRWQNVKNEILR